MSHPYVPSGGILQTAINQFRQSFPVKVDSETLKKLAVASGNENGVINVLKFLELIDDQNQRTEAGKELFTLHNDNEFSENLAKQIEKAYSELFELRSDGAWTADQDELISFFRRSDNTSAVVGKRQAITFQTLSSLSAKRSEEVAARGRYTGRKTTEAGNPKKASEKKDKPDEKTYENKKTGKTDDQKNHSNIALTVRVEVNLPANASKDAYDHIFASIKKNLIDGNS